MRVHGLLVNLLCSIVVVANTQTIPYLSFLGNNLSNHSYVDFSTVGDENNSIQCHTDLVTCCNSDQGTDRGDWFYPSGERVSINNSDSEPFYQHWASQSVDLRYRGEPAVPSIMGIYQCAIETSAVNNENNTARQVLYVGLYNSTGGERLIRRHFRIKLYYIVHSKRQCCIESTVLRVSEQDGMHERNPATITCVTLHTAYTAMSRITGVSTLIRPLYEYEYERLYGGGYTSYCCWIPLLFRHFHSFPTFFIILLISVPVCVSPTPLVAHMSHVHRPI